MTVIFQLFCAEDLQKLCPDQLEGLRSTIQQVFSDTKAISQTAQGRPALSLEISTDTNPPTSANPQLTEQIKEALNKRFHEVSQQLKSSQLNPSQFDFEKLRRRHFNEDEDEKKKEGTILSWAISCEVNNFKFYDRLLSAGEAAYRFFFQETGQRPKGPDSLYSPFYPQHPLYYSFYNLENLKLDLKPAQDAADSSC
jgi:hypothetical protein